MTERCKFVTIQEKQTPWVKAKVTIGRCLSYIRTREPVSSILDITCIVLGIKNTEGQSCIIAIVYFLYVACVEGQNNSHVIGGLSQ